MITLDQGETIKKVIRSHHLLFVLEIAFIAVVSILPFVLYEANALDKLVSEDPARTGYLLLFFYGIWLLICWIFAYLAWIEYYLGAWIITDARIMIARQNGLLKRNLEGVRFDKIQEVVVGLKGSIKIILAKGEGAFTIPSVPHADAVKELIVYEQRQALDRLKASLTIDELEMNMI